MAGKGRARTRKSRNVTKLRNVESLERLRDRVEAAAEEIVQLRGENARLASDISGLRVAADEASDVPTVVFEEDPSELRAKVEGFIKAIDEYLQVET